MAGSLWVTECAVVLPGLTCTVTSLPVGESVTKSPKSSRGGGRSTRPRRWASSWREPKVPETWIATDASGRSIEKFATWNGEATRLTVAAGKLRAEGLIDYKRGHITVLDRPGPTLAKLLGEK